MTEPDHRPCICRQLLELGIVEALENTEQRDAIFAAMQACLDKSQCLEGVAPLEAATATHTPATASPAAAPSRRKRADRRAGIERRQNKQAWPAENERRSGMERRSGGDRRGLLEGEQYTPQQAFLNLKAWCNGHCKSPFDLSLDKASGELKFRFEDPVDRADFTEMLRLFKGMSGGPKSPT